MQPATHGALAPQLETLDSIVTGGRQRLQLTVQGERMLQRFDTAPSAEPEADDVAGQSEHGDVRYEGQGLQIALHTGVVVQVGHPADLDVDWRETAADRKQARIRIRRPVDALQRPGELAAVILKSEGPVHAAGGRRIASLPSSTASAPRARAVSATGLPFCTSAAPGQIKGIPRTAAAASMMPFNSDISSAVTTAAG